MQTHFAAGPRHESIGLIKAISLGQRAPSCTLYRVNGKALNRVFITADLAQDEVTESEALSWKKFYDKLTK